MEKLKLNYYFNHLDEFEYKELFANCTYPWEALEKVSPMLEEKVVKPNLKINN